MLFKILIAGDGGQGVQTMAEIISKAAFQNNKHVSFVPNYGLEQRGGASLAFIQISDRDIVYPKFSKPDILVLMSEQARERAKLYCDELRIENKELRVYNLNDFAATIEAQNIKPFSHNIFLLGVLALVLGQKEICEKEKVFELLEKKISQKPGWEDNKKAFAAGEDCFLMASR
ncbi:hypothetical protein EPN28_02390 [Patescibacteria group bacterium]|nr:MAG: hypothetical protein EPN28_02390 [Patescibacteria group bacterium]